MTDQAPELLPCPLCGGKAAYYLGVEGAFRATWEVHLVHCTVCQARVQTTVKENTITRWNTRPTPAERPDALDLELKAEASAFDDSVMEAIDNAFPSERPVPQVREAVDYNMLAKGEDKVLRDLAIVAMSEQTGSRSLMATAEAAVNEIIKLRALTARPSDAAGAWRAQAVRLIEKALLRNVDGPRSATARKAYRFKIANEVAAALAIPHEEAVRALDRDGAHTAIEAICDYADNNLSMFEACTENDPVGARKIYEAAKCLRDLLAPTPTVASERVSERETEQPRVTDDDKDSITVTFNGRELRGWSYASDEERRVKMTAAREYVEGWCDGRQI